MDTAGNERWLPRAALIGLVYLVVGITFAALSHASGTSQMRVAWRLGAWLASAAVFSAHTFYEHARRRHTPPTAAFHVALAVALGALALAVAADARAHWAASSQPRPLATAALVVWPVVSAVPAFLVALAIAAVLARRRRARA